VSDATRTVLIALGLALLVAVLLPAVFMGSMMASMTSGGTMGGGGPWVMLALAMLVVAAGVVLLAAGLRR
jgi:hypothetical protein